MYALVRLPHDLSVGGTLAFCAWSTVRTQAPNNTEPEREVAAAADPEAPQQAPDGSQVRSSRRISHVASHKTLHQCEDEHSFRFGSRYRLCW
jgi:hypothetical protein